ncbi:MAG: hypothetical protein HC923_06405 [Myxococcales bacterium]|nr:hypothetical protein [Myxococcales bacterium]
MKISLKDGRWFPLMLAAILLTSVGANIYLIVRATNDPSFAVEPDYYQKAVNWDRAKAERSASDALGWQMELNADTTSLRISLRDRLGRPIDGAFVEVEAFHNARANERLRGKLLPVGRGEYVLDQRFERAGLWEFRVAASVDDQRYVHVAQEDVP